MAEFDSLKVKDQLGRPEDKGLFVKRKTEEVIIEANTVEVYKQSLGNSWIVGSATNGIVGTNTDTEGGGQQVVGADSRVDVVQAVVNPGKIYREQFRDSWFSDTGVTTADWAVVSGTLAFTNTEIAQSRSIAYNDGTVIRATINVTASVGVTTDLAFQMSANGGSNWENVTLGTEHTFTNTGTDLRYKITASGSVTVTYIRVDYI